MIFSKWNRTVHHFTLAGGYLAHSLAIMTDAAHLLADVGSMMGSLFSLWLSTRPATRTMTFGWHRSGKAPAWPGDPSILSEGTSQRPGQASDSLSPPAETLGALASVVSLWMVTGILLYLAFIRLLHSDYHIEGGAMLLTASIAVCANLLYVPVWSRHHVGLRARGLPPGWESWLSPP